MKARRPLTVTQHPRHRVERRRGCPRNAWIAPVLALIFAAATAQALEWKPTAGPYGGVIQAFYTTSDGVTLTGTDSGEICSTQDQGASWALVPGELPERSVLCFIEKDGRLYVGGAACGVRLTTARRGRTSTASRWCILRSTPWRSSTISCTSPPAGASPALTRKATIDTWTTLIRGLRNVLVRDLLAFEDTLLGATHGGVYKFDIETSQWTESSRGLTAGNGVAPMVLTLVKHAGSLFAGTATQGVFRSDDGGASWDKASTGLAAPGAATTSLQVVDLLSTGAAIVTSIAGQGLYASENGGETWAAYAEGIPNRYTNALHQDGDVLLAGTYGTGVYRRGPSDASWTYASEGIRDTSVFALASDGARLYMGGSGGVFVSSDGGDEWLPSNAGLAALNLRRLSIIDGMIYAGTYHDGYYTSKDSGATWTRVSGDLFNRLTVRTVKRLGGAYYAATAGQGVIVSQDGATSWAPSNEGSALPFVTMLDTVGDTLYAGTDGKGIYASEDGAATWTRLGSGMSKPYVFAMATLGDDKFVATYGSGVYQLVDDAWEPRSVGLGNMKVRALVAVGDTLYAGTAEAGVFVSTDAGMTWAEANDGWAERRVRVLLVVGDTLYAGTARGGVYKAPLP